MVCPLVLFFTPLILFYRGFFSRNIPFLSFRGFRQDKVPIYLSSFLPHFFTIFSTPSFLSISVSDQRIYNRIFVGKPVPVQLHIQRDSRLGIGGNGLRQCGGDHSDIICDSLHLIRSIHMGHLAFLCFIRNRVVFLWDGLAVHEHRSRLTVSPAASSGAPQTTGMKSSPASYTAGPSPRRHPFRTARIWSSGRLPYARTRIPRFLRLSARWSV